MYHYYIMYTALKRSADYYSHILCIGLLFFQRKKVSCYVLNAQQVASVSIHAWLVLGGNKKQVIQSSEALKGPGFISKISRVVQY